MLFLVGMIGFIVPVTHAQTFEEWRHQAIVLRSDVSSLYSELSVKAGEGWKYYQYGESNDPQTKIHLDNAKQHYDKANSMLMQINEDLAYYSGNSEYAPKDSVDNFKKMLVELDSVRDEIIRGEVLLELANESETNYHQSRSNESLCGPGTEMKDGLCTPIGNSNISGGGCLIATATFDSELSPQVQKLREIRDSKLLQTQSGGVFMESFNSFYYSFSPYIADYERENPLFKEMVKVAITPMITSLSILNHVDMDSESSVLGYGISLIILNGLMYVGIPASVIVVIRRF